MCLWLGPGGEGCAATLVAGVAAIPCARPATGPGTVPERAVLKRYLDELLAADRDDAGPMEARR
jgi:hypothetical protein